MGSLFWRKEKDLTLDFGTCINYCSESEIQKQTGK